jgi:hypothetical protein
MRSVSKQRLRTMACARHGHGPRFVEFTSLATGQVTLCEACGARINRVTQTFLTPDEARARANVRPC